MKLDEAKLRASELPSVLAQLPGELQSTVEWILPAIEHKRINIMPNTVEQSRRVLGCFIMAGFTHTVRKPWETARTLQVTVQLKDGWVATISEYRPASCKLEKRKITLPAEDARPAREALPERDGFEEVLVCEDSSGKTTVLAK